MAGHGPPLTCTVNTLGNAVSRRRLLSCAMGIEYDEAASAAHMDVVHELRTTLWLLWCGGSRPCAA